MEHLTKETFIEKVFDFQNETDWKFKGTNPAIIDFYADWCQPCKMLSPILDELAKEYEGKIDVYKVNTEEQYELAGAFGIRSIPSVLYIPMTGSPAMATGLAPKEDIIKTINDVIFKEKASAFKHYEFTVTFFNEVSGRLVNLLMSCLDTVPVIFIEVLF